MERDEDTATFIPFDCQVVVDHVISTLRKAAREMDYEHFFTTALAVLAKELEWSIDPEIFPMLLEKELQKCISEALGCDLTCVETLLVPAAQQSVSLYCTEEYLDCISDIECDLKPNAPEESTPDPDVEKWYSSLFVTEDRTQHQLRLSIHEEAMDIESLWLPTEMCGGNDTMYT